MCDEKFMYYGSDADLDQNCSVTFKGETNFSIKIYILLCGVGSGHMLLSISK